MIFPFIRNEDIDAEALRLRVEALPPGTSGDIPVDLDVILFEYLCERDELIVDLDTALPDEDGDEVLGKTGFRPGRIQVNARLRPDSGRFRFTLAHEIGHWILHRAVVLAEVGQIGLFGGPPPVARLTTLNRSVTDPRPPREEIQANRFAAALLIDHSALRREFNARFGTEGVRETLQRLGALTFSARDQARTLARSGPAPNLADLFGVSVEAMSIAIEGRNYLPGGATLFDA